MPLHEMAAQPVGGPQGAFQIDGPALSPLSNQRPLERRRDGMHAKAALHDALDGQTSAVYSDTLAPLDATIRRANRQGHARIPFPVSRFPCRFSDPSHRIYDSGKHSRRSKTNNVSEPNGRRSTTTQRGASSSGNAGIPGKAGTAPSPSQTGDCTQYRRSTRPSASNLVPSAPPPSHNNDWIPASRNCANAWPRVSGRKTRTPFPSSTDTFEIGASGDAMTQ